ncbi:MAG: 50S ribosomal protein L9 [Deltaproteobacteria bacterium]|nr:50S ribosomal protein L9 [Deltaproteobacteria bacterium]
MEVILREEVPHLGVTGDVVKVKPGYARNYLLPRGLAIVADRRNVKVLDHLKRVAAEKGEREKRAGEALAQKVTSLRLTIKARAGEEGKLFGSVTNQDIEKAMATAGFTVERRRIRLAEPIKTLGEHMVPVHLAVGVDAHVTIVVEAEREA